MLTIKQKFEDDLKYIGRNHLNSKITELLDLGVELAEINVKTFSDILDVINKRVAIYRDIAKERYSE